MKWYAAHVVMSVSLKSHTQDTFPAWENIVLVAARSQSEAFSRAEDYGRQEEGDEDGTFVWGGKPACWIFQGVRKLTECALLGQRPDDGDEVSFNELEFESLAAIEKFAAGESATAKFHDRFRAPKRSKAGVTSKPKRKGA